VTADTAFQEAVRDAVLEVTGGEDVLRVTHTQALPTGGDPLAHERMSS